MLIAYLYLFCHPRGSIPKYGQIINHQWSNHNLLIFKAHLQAPASSNSKIFSIAEEPKERVLPVRSNSKREDTFWASFHVSASELHWWKVSSCSSEVSLSPKQDMHSSGHNICVLAGLGGRGVWDWQSSREDMRLNRGENSHLLVWRWLLYWKPLKNKIAHKGIHINKQIKWSFCSHTEASVAFSQMDLTVIGACYLPRNNK